MINLFSQFWILFVVTVSCPTWALDVIKDKDEPVKQQLQVLTLPLLSHNQILQRRRLELGRTSDSTDPLVDEQHRPRFNRHTRHLSLRRSLATNHTIAPLYQGFGTHYVDLWVGSPTPQRQTVIVDTGSSITAFPCSECSVSCGSGYHTDTTYQEDVSTSFLPSYCEMGSFNTLCTLGSCQAVAKFSLPQQGPNDGVCRISASYQEGSSWTAFTAKDWVYVGGSHDHPIVENNAVSEKTLIVESNKNEPVIKSIASLDAMIHEEIAVIEKKEVVSSTTTIHPTDFRFQLDFGCQTKITGLFITQLADGIMGVDNTPLSFWNQMYSSGVIPNKVFSLCFSHAESVSRTGSGAGLMTLGGFDSRLHTSNIAYAQNIEQSGWFTVSVRALYLHDQATQTTVPLEIDMVDFNRGGVIVDSGTTDTYLASIMKRPFRRAFKKLSGRDFDDKMTLASQQELDALPTLLVQLQSATFSQNDSNHVDHNNPTDVVMEIPASHYLECSHSFSCQAVLFMTENSGGVLGANAMTGYDVIFDPEHSRVGFAASGCNYQSVSN